MSAVPIYVTAAISALAAILGAAVVPIGAAYQATRQARRDRQHQHETALRDECIALLRAAWDLRTMVMNNHEYHGAEMGDRLAKVRECAADTGVRWVIIVSLVSGELGDAAERVATAAADLAAAAAEHTDLDHGRSVRAPELGELDAAIRKFSELVGSSLLPAAG